MTRSSCWAILWDSAGAAAELEQLYAQLPAEAQPCYTTMASIEYVGTLCTLATCHVK